MVPFQTAVRQYFANYVNFRGRASRAQFWWPVLFNFLVGFAIETLIFIIVTPVASSQTSYTVSYAITSLYSLAVFLPSLAVLVRRLHDIGKGGGWIFISFLPLIGTIWLLVLLLTAGQPFDNRFGSDPSDSRPTPPPFYS